MNTVWRDIVSQIYTDGEALFREAWLEWLEGPAQLRVIFTPNPEQMMLARRSRAFAELLLSADILLPDGIGLEWLHNRWRERWGLETLRSRITGADTVEWWLDTASVRKTRTLLLGSREGVAESVALHRDAHRDWCWGSEGYKDADHSTDAEEKAFKTLLQESRPEVVLVAFGAPKQERWIADHRDQLEKAGVRVVLACGGTLDYLAGNVKRAPESWRKLGLEWLYRLSREPWRWQRQQELLRFIREALSLELSWIESKQP